MKRKVTMVGISGDEFTLLPEERDMMSSRKILFPSNSMPTRQGRIFSPYESWGLFSSSLFTYFCHSLLSVSSFWCSFHHVPPSILPQ